MSLRDVAQEANVNLGLIHRYIGSKHDLLAAVLSARPGYPPPDANALRSPEQIVDVVLELVSTDADYARIMLRSALDGFDISRLQNTFPVLERAARAARSELPRRDADVRIALLAATALSWQSIGEELLGALKQRNVSHDEVVATLRPALLAFLTAAPASDPT